MTEIYPRITTKKQVLAKLAVFRDWERTQAVPNLSRDFDDMIHVVERLTSPEERLEALREGDEEE